MDAIQEQLEKPLVVGIASFVVGVLIGLVVLGWQLWPVQWTDAGPQHLRKEFKEIYLRMAIDSYALNPDPTTAQQRLDEVGEDGPEILAEIKTSPGRQSPQAIDFFVSLVPGGVVPEITPQATPTTTSVSLARTLLPIMCVITFLLAGALVAAFLLRNRIRGITLPGVRKPEPVPRVERIEYAVPEEEPPLAQFMTTYTVGNDLFDDSFSIDSPAGEFLGECGVGISESIGVGEPKKVTAFEVWLFDKNDIQTVTKVLMSRHAFNDESILHRLEAKGEPVYAEPGREMVLETQTLRLIARVVDMSYGAGALPPQSFFDRLTMELVVWPK